MAKPKFIKFITDTDTLHITSMTADYASSECREALVVLKERLNSTKGCQGVSAIQVGIPICVCVCKLNGEVIEMLNPRMKFKFWFQFSNEGCESIPNKRYGLWRPLLGLVEYYDVSGRRQSKWLGKKNVRIVSHEIDHTNGVLISDKGREWKFDTKSSGHYLPKRR